MNYNMNDNEESMNIIPHEESYIPQKKGKKKRPVMKVIAGILCATSLMLGSGYVGARIAQENFVANSVYEESNEPEEINSEIEDKAKADEENQIERLNNAPEIQGKMSLPELFDASNPAVVAIFTETTTDNFFGQTITRPAAGSGFFVSADGYIVTNDHVIEGSDSITVSLYDGTELPATVVGRAPESDLAVLKIEGEDFNYVEFGDSDSLRVGEQVAAIGNPLGELANSMTVGYISAVNRDISIEGNSQSKIQTDTPVNPGNSGGPLFNLYGDVIGVVSAKSAGVNIEGLGFAIPSNYAQGIVEQLIEYGFIRGRAILGITVGRAENAVVVASVGSGSVAEQAGMLMGDIIISANGIAVQSFEDLRGVLDEASPGDAMEIIVRRSNEVLTLSVILDEYRPDGI